MIDPEELSLWADLWHIDNGWGEERADIRAASITAAVLAPYCKQPPKISDCMPFPSSDLARAERVSERQQAAAGWLAFGKAKAKRQG
jgi:hypothetical protein